MNPDGNRRMLDKPRFSTVKGKAHDLNDTCCLDVSRGVPVVRCVQLSAKNYSRPQSQPEVCRGEMEREMEQERGKDIM